MGLFDFFKKKNKSEVIEEEQSTNSAAAVEEVTAETENDMNDAVEAAEEAVQEAEEAEQTAEEETAAEAHAPQAAPNPVNPVLTPEQHIDRHNDQRSGESLQTCIKALSTSWLWVPMRIQMSNEDADAVRNAGKGVKVRPKDPVKLRPELLKNKDGKVFMPVFATKEEVPEDMRKRFVWVQMPSGQCGLYVLQNQQVGALIVNPFSKGLVLQRELLSKILKPVPPAQEAVRPDTITS